MQSIRSLSQSALHLLNPAPNHALQGTQAGGGASPSSTLDSEASIAELDSVDMPSRAPRTDTAKKREQLARREQELDHAIRSTLSRDQLVRAAEGVRAAQMSLLKAELYWIEESRIVARGVMEPGVDARISNIQRDQQRWAERSIGDILNEYTTT
jgi:hypothetical protein